MLDLQVFKLIFDVGSLNKYSAKVPDDVYNSLNGNLYIGNQAMVTSKENPEGKSDWENVTLSRTLFSKQAQLSENGKSVLWTITVNGGSNSVNISDAVVSDKLPDGCKIISDVTVSFDNKKITIPHGEDYVNYIIPESNKNYIIQFETTVNTQIGSTTTNIADLTLKDGNKFKDDASVYIPGIGNFHTKEPDSTTPYEIVETADGGKAGVIHWINTIVVPGSDVYELKNFEFNDYVANWQSSVNQRIVGDSFQVVYNGRIINPSNYTVTMQNNATAFTIDFGNYFQNAKKDEKIIISYDSQFDLVSESTTIYNYSQINLNKQQVSFATGGCPFVPRISKAVANVSDDEDDSSGVNKIFTWRVQINMSEENDNELPDVLTLKDILPENQILKEGSVCLWNDMWWDGEIYVVPSEYIHDDGKTVTFSIPKEILKRKTKNDVVYLRYQTTFDDISTYLTGESTTYKNIIQLLNGDVVLEQAEAVTGTITPPKNKVLNKRLLQYGSYTGGFAYYAIDVNEIGATINNGNPVKVIDTMGKALEYVPGTLKVYTKPDCGKESILTPDKYTLTYSKEENTLTLVVPDNQPCYIRYTVTVKLSSGETFDENDVSSEKYAGNQVRLEGTNKIVESEPVKLRGNVAQASGTVKYNTAEVYLYKSDFLNDGQWLEGAEYTAQIVALWEQGKPITATPEVLAEHKITDSIVTGITGDEGTAIFSKLRYDCLYAIRETKAPEGYQINDDITYIYFKGHDDADFDILKTIEPYIGHEFICVPKKDVDSFYPLSVTDKKLPEELKYFEISKRAAFGDTSNISGAVLQLTDKDGKTVAEWTTGSNCRKFLVYEGDIDKNQYDEFLLTPGTYTLTETKAPDGFALSEEKIQFTVDINGKITGTTAVESNSDSVNILVMKDNRTVCIKKVDSDGNPLPNAKLSIKRGNDTILSLEGKNLYEIEVTAGNVEKNGALQAETSYKLVEEAPLNGYKQIDDIEFQVNNDGTIKILKGTLDEYKNEKNVLTVIDKTYIKLQVIKTDAYGNKFLSGAAFRLKDENGKEYTETTTNGIAEFDELTYGNYTLIEETAPSGYEIITKEIPIILGTGSNALEITNDGVAIQTVKNSKEVSKTGNIEITKTDRETAETLVGVSFTLENDSYKATMQTDKEGIAKFDNVPYGTYTLTEELPYNYEFIDSFDSVKVNGITVNPVSGTSWEVKVGENSPTPLKITVTNSKRKGRISFSKIDQIGNIVSGAEFGLYDGNNLIMSNKDSGNAYTFKNVPYGVYTLKEINPPKYYQGTAKEIKVIVNKEKVTLDEPIENTLLSVAIDKRSIDGTVTLPYATLGIFPESSGSNDFKKEDAIAIWETYQSARQFYLTDGDAKLLNNREDAKILYINEGKYILHEIKSPAGYDKAKDITFTVTYREDASGNRTASITNVDNGYLDNGILVMRDVPVGTLRLIKKSSEVNNNSNDLLSDAVFELYDKEDNKVTITSEQSNQYKTNYEINSKNYSNVFVTDSIGKIEVSNLPYGTYVFKEVEPPDGYKLSSDDAVNSTTFVLPSDTSAEVEHIVYNVPNKPENKHTIIIKKVDRNTDNHNSTLYGARFDVYRIEDKKLTFIDGGTTNVDNETVKLEGLPSGDYIVVETKAPKDYMFDGACEVTVNSNKLDSKAFNVDSELPIPKDAILKFKITIEENTTEIQIKVENVKKTRREFWVKKVDEAEPDKGLSGAVFGLYSNENDEIPKYTQTTKEDGTACFENVEHGTYYLRETTEPDGYERRTDAIKIVLDDTTEGKKLNFRYEGTAGDPYIIEDKIIKLQINKYVTGTDETVPDAELKITKTDLSSNETPYVQSWNTNIYHPLELYFTKNKSLINQKTNGRLYICPGTYTLEETKVKNYKKVDPIEFVVTDDGKIQFKIKPSGEIATIKDNGRNLIIYDEPCGSIEITKINAESKQPINNGVEFKIYKNGNVKNYDTVDKLPTDLTPEGIFKYDAEKKKFTISGLPLGEYAIFETATPTGYVKNTQKYVVNITEVNYKEPIDLKISNTPEAKRGDIVLTKKSAVDDQLLLNGGIFKLYDAQGELFATAKLNNGTLSFTNLPMGEYTIIEETPPENYSISFVAEENDYVVNEDQKSIKVSLTEKGCRKYKDDSGNLKSDIFIEATDDILRGDLQVVKVDSKNHAPLSGSQFVLIQYDKEKDLYSIIDGIDDTKLPKLKKLNDFDIKNIDINELSKEGTTFDTDGNGLLLIENLPFAQYYLIEVKAPENYKRSEEYYQITIDKDNRAEKHEVTEVIVENERLTGNLTIRKFETGTDTPLRGAVYNLYSDNTCQQLVSTGGRTEKDGSYTFWDIPFGDYWVLEAEAPDNYAIDTLPRSVQITSSETNTVDVISGVYDEKAKVSLIVNKKDENGKPISGVEFNVYKSSVDNENEESLVGSIQTGADGIGRLEEPVECGYYILREKVPEYYTAESNDITLPIVTSDIVMNREQDSTVTYSFSKDITNQNKSFRISKKASSKPLGEIADIATLGIFDKDNAERPLLSWKTGTEPQIIYLGAETKQDGNILTLQEGTYILAEIETPKGYYPAPPITFTVDKNGTVTNIQQESLEGRTPAKLLNADGYSLIEMYDDDKEGSIWISKKAVGGTDELKNANLQIFDSSRKNALDSWTVSENNARSISVGSNGVLQYDTDYVLVEVNAPQGYAWANDIPFYVKHDGSIVIGSINKDLDNIVISDNISKLDKDIYQLTMFDQRLTSVEDNFNPTPDAFTDTDGSPKTGDDTPLVLLILLIVAAVAVIAGLVVTGRKKSKQEEADEEDKN